MDRDLRRALHEQGWRVERTRGGHYLCFAPDGQGIVTLASTPSDYRARKNAMAKLRSMGFQ